jgi:hypothetical protein
MSVLCIADSVDSAVGHVFYDTKFLSHTVNIWSLLSGAGGISLTHECLQEDVINGIWYLAV